MSESLDKMFERLVRCEADTHKGSLSEKKELGHQVRNVCHNPYVISRETKILECKGYDLLSPSKPQDKPRWSCLVGANFTECLGGNGDHLVRNSVRTQKVLANKAKKANSSSNENVSPSPEVVKKISHEPEDTTYKPLERYKMDAKPRGFCLVILIHTFIDSNGKISNRPGAVIDRARLEKTFKRLGFVTVVFQNLDDQRLQEKMMEYAQQDHSSYDCFVCYIGTHGCEDTICGSNWEDVGIPDILSYFGAHNCPSLAGKPKLFFFDSCRGHNDLPRNGAPLQEDAFCKKEKRTVRIPNLADFCVCFPTSYKCVTYSNSVDGSYYVQELAKVLDKYGHREEITTLLTRVNDALSKRSIEDKDGNEKMLVPATQSSLRKQLFFPLLR